MPQPNNSQNAHYIEHLGIKALKSSHPGVRRLKRQQQGHSAHGNKVWRSSFVLMDYLSSYPPAPKSRVLDIGCGWGLTGLFLAKQYATEVTGIDIDDSVAPFLALQAEINQCAMAFQARGFETLTSDELSGYQTIIGTDICFWDELTEPLFDLLKLAISAGVERIIIADPGRPPFWDLVDRSAETLDASVVTRRIYEPWKTEKYMLVIDRA
ncbi:methyltransferase domain-containing protein [Porticoccaceae bacterium]|jgi:predicted nicotinamide N-methyase|nr:methyltransferase domain-containing protein [Porticoccaceae bacterium]